MANSDQPKASRMTKPGSLTAGQLDTKNTEYGHLKTSHKQKNDYYEKTQHIMAQRKQRG